MAWMILNKLLVFFLMLFILIGSAFAVQLDLSGDAYLKGDQIQIQVQDCNTDFIVSVKNPLNQTVYLFQNKGDQIFFYDSNFNGELGRYNVAIACRDGNSDLTFFDLSDANALLSVGKAYSESEASTNSEENSPGASDSSTNINSNEDEPALTSSGCLEAWECQPWQDCVEGKQIRECLDLNSCGTDYKKPLIERECQKEVISQNDLVGEDYFSNGGVGISSGTGLSLSFIEKYHNLIYFFSSILLIIIIFIFVFLLHLKKKSLNPTLINYINKEKNKGISNAKIKSALIKSGWNQDEVEIAIKT